MSPAPASYGSHPTDREVAVLRAYLEMGSVKDAARLLGIAEQTAKLHLWNLRSRLGAKTTAEVVFLLHDRLAA